MFGLFKKDPKTELKKRYAETLERAMNAQRNGDIRGYSELQTEAEEILEQLDKLLV